MTRKELKEQLPLTVEVVFVGTNRISKDLLPVLWDSEQVIDIFKAKQRTVITILWKIIALGLRCFRSYMVVTNKRFIYIERMGLHKRTLMFDRFARDFSITQASGWKKLIYPYIFSGMYQGQQYRVAVKEDMMKYLSECMPGENTDSDNTHAHDDSQQNEDKHMFCAFCGKPIDNGWMCCPACGHKVKET